MKGLFIGFILIQLAIDLAHSVTAFPFVHYGMFSESFSRQDSLAVFEVIADGKRLNPADFPVYQWDQIQNPLYALEKEQNTADFAFDKDKFRSGLEKIGAGSLYPRLSPQLDNSPGLAQQFPVWYKGYLSRLTHHTIQTLRVDKVWYRYTGAGMVELNSTTYINS